MCSSSVARSFAERGGRLLVLGDPAAHPHHVGERPVGDALAVGEAAAAMPVDGLGDAVEVLVELPAETRLADPGDAGDRHEVRLALVGARVEEILDLAQLAVAADERRLEALRLERAAQPGDDALRPPERRQPFLALQLERAGVLVDDRLLGRAPRRLADEHRPGLGDRLHARGRVHEVAGDHPLARRADRHRRLAGQHAGARAQILGAPTSCRRARRRRRRGRAPPARRARRRPRSPSAFPRPPSRRRR